METYSYGLCSSVCHKSLVIGAKHSKHLKGISLKHLSSSGSYPEESCGPSATVGLPSPVPPEEEVIQNYILAYLYFGETYLAHIVSMICRFSDSNIVPRMGATVGPTLVRYLFESHKRY